MEPYHKAKQHALKAQMVLNDQAMPTWEKVHNSLLVFKGMLLSSIPTKTQKSVESVMLKIQRVFNRYPIKTFDTGQIISPFIVSALEWENKHCVTPLYKNIKEEGIEL